MNPTENAIKIFAIKQPHGYYIYANCYSSYFNDKLINGAKPINSFVTGWYLVPNKPEKIEEEQTQPNINFRYELIDASMQSERIPLSFTKEEVTKFDEDGYAIWKDEYRHLQSLYELRSDPQPNIMVEIPFEFIELFEADHEAEKRGEFSYPVKKTVGWSVQTEIDDSCIKHRLSDEMYVSDLYLHEKPCKLDSRDFYEIIREHVKRNIDSKYAVVTSDYDFCFTVKKRLAYAEPIKYTVQVDTGKRRAKKRLEERYTTARDVEIFNMTPDSKKYEGYQVLPGIEAPSEAELKKKIDEYLADLMEFINAPLVDCPCCKGRGAIVPEMRKP